MNLDALSSRPNPVVCLVALSTLLQDPVAAGTAQAELLSVVRDVQDQTRTIRFHYIESGRYLSVEGPDPNDPSKPLLKPRTSTSTGLFKRLDRAHRLAYVSSGDRVATITMSDGKHAAMYREGTNRGTWDQASVMPVMVPFMKFLGVPSATDTDWMEARSLEEAISKANVRKVANHPNRAVYRLEGRTMPCEITVDPRHIGCITKVSFHLERKGVEVLEEWTLSDFVAAGKKKRLPTKFSSRQKYVDQGVVYSNDERSWTLTGVSDQVTLEEVLRPLPNGVKFFTYAGEKSVEVKAPRWDRG